MISCVWKLTLKFETRSFTTKMIEKNHEWKCLSDTVVWSDWNFAQCVYKIWMCDWLKFCSMIHLEAFFLVPIPHNSQVLITQKVMCVMVCQCVMTTDFHEHDLGAFPVSSILLQAFCLQNFVTHATHSIYIVTSKQSCNLFCSFGASKLFTLNFNFVDHWIGYIITGTFEKQQQFSSCQQLK